MLNEMPRDMLRLIFDRNFSFLVLPLYLCGDRVLNDKLENGGIEHLELASTHHYSTSRWPKMIKNLKLRSLSISRTGGEFGATKTIQHELKAIVKRSTQLEKLKIKSRSCEEIFFGLVRSDSTPIGSDAISDIEQIDWNPLCPSLTELELIRPRGGGYSMVTILPLHLAMIPSQIASLTLLTFSRDQEYDNLSMFPRLERIKTSSSTITPAGLLSLSNTITCIEKGLNDEALTLLATNYQKNDAEIGSDRILPHLAQIPSYFNYIRHEELAKIVDKGLPQKLALMKSWMWKKYFSSFWPLPLPSTITSLILSKHTLSKDMKLEKIFPPSLTKLKVLAINWKSFEQSFDSSEPQSTPTSLQTPSPSSSLRLSSLPHNRSSIASIWPPILENLSILQDIHFSPLHFDLLPPSLVKLSCNKLCDGSFPSGEHSDDLEEEKLLEKGRASLGLPMPTTSLHVAQSNSSYITTPYSPSLKSNREAINEGRLFGLPLSITSLKISHINTHGQSFTITLPPTCKKAIVAHNLTFSVNHFFASLPSSLHLLKLSPLPFINPTWNDALEEGSPLGDCTIRDLTLYTSGAPDDDDYYDDPFDSDVSYDHLTESEGDDDLPDLVEDDEPAPIPRGSSAPNPPQLPIDRTIFEERLFLGLPRTLTRLSIDINYSLKTHCLASSALPQTLTSLVITTLSIIDTYGDSIKASMESGGVDESPHWFSLLPCSLEMLVLFVADSSSILEGRCLRYLPKKLAYAQFPRMFCPSINDLASLPPALTVLNITRLKTLEEETVKEGGERSILSVLSQSIDEFLSRDSSLIPLLIRFRAMHPTSGVIDDFFWGQLLSYQYLDVDPRILPASHLIESTLHARQQHLAYIRKKAESGKSIEEMADELFIGDD